jgi:hypothetical protein
MFKPNIDFDIIPTISILRHKKGLLYHVIVDGYFQGKVAEEKFGREKGR